MLAILLIILVCSTLAAARPPASAALVQALLRQPQTTSMATVGKEVPGNNNATFCNVPSEEQLFRVEFLDVAPSPLPV